MQTKAIKKTKQFVSFMLVLTICLTMIPILGVKVNASMDEYLFQWEWYYNKNPDLQKAFGKNAAKLRSHYINYGKREGRSPSDVFNPVYYLNRYPDLKAAFGNDYKAAYNHFINNGIREGRQASESFNVEIYKSNYSDLQKAFGTKADDNWEYIRHWSQYGRKEGRNAVTKISTTTGATTNNNNSPTQTTTTMYVKTGNPNNRLNMRSSESTSASIVTKLSYGTKVTVHSIYNGWAKVTANGKTGFVSTQYLSETNPINNSNGSENKNLSGTEAQVQARLDQIANGKRSIDDSTTMAVGKVFKGTRSSEECKGYARNVFNICFGINIGSTVGKPKNYQISSTKGVSTVGSVTNMTENNISKLFSQARVGEFCQMRRSHGGSHSAIVYSVSDSGVTFLEANTDGKNTVMLNTYDWAALCKDNQAMSIYTPNNYALK